jgi:hypothetical protein
VFTDYWADDTLGGLIVHQQRYRPNDSNTDYWADETLGGLIVHQQEYHLPSSQCYYHWVGTSAGGLLVPVVSVAITGSVPLLVDY